jgi:hypothetical protein
MHRNLLEQTAVRRRRAHLVSVTDYAEVLLCRRRGADGGRCHRLCRRLLAVGTSTSSRSDLLLKQWKGFCIAAFEAITLKSWARL